MSVTIILQQPNAVTLQNATPATVTINKNVLPPVWGEILGTLSTQSDLQGELDAKENIANKSTAITLGTSDTLYPTQNAVKTYVDTEIGNIPAPTTPTLDSVTDQGSTTTNSINVGGLTASNLVYPSSDGTADQIIQTDGNGNLSFVDLPNDAVWGNITGTLSTQTDLQTALDDKEDVSNKSTDVTMGGASPSSTLYTSEYAVATYVQNEIAQAQSGIPTFEIDMFANYKIYESDEDGNTTYVGTIKATNGNWLITKYVDNSGDITATYANESNNSAQTTPTLAWTNRATLNYTAVNNLTSI